ncbi:MBL fold metallo-hydrolase [Thalassospira australica]|uniref:MBL fold metallo-hydrolase n=1 Tax=Thalassospira australica TaxID=1528106 RepID=UPI00051A7927|nr:MBL fold metallo-hydrolase [Thalassospira australica]
MKANGKLLGLAGIIVAASMTFGAASQAQTVKVTPLGAVDGEFCPLDRAMIFEDPDGTRILYDTGRTVAGPDDARLGDIDAVLLSHMHGDHLGDRHIEAVNASECGKPSFPVDVRSVSNTVQIANAKDALIVTGSEMPGILGGKLKSIGGDPKKSVLVRFGASRMVGGVKITTVPAVHSNGVSGDFLGGPLGEMLKTAGVTAYAGPPTGYVLTFSNGLSVYLSGDTGITAEQDTVVRGHYGAKLVVMNIGDTYTTGPTEAAYVVNDLIQPASVIPSHANEWATDGGVVRSGTRTEAFINAVNVAAHVPLSGKTMAFDASGMCASGC